MHMLDRKLVRDMRRLWAQSFAIALLLGCGVAILVLSFGTQRSLSETRQTFYERNRFADVFALAVRAPENLKADIEAIPGVSVVQTRISHFAILDIEGLVEPAMGQFLSIPGDGPPALNAPLLVSGRFPVPNASDEVVVNLPFAEANGFRPGDSLQAILNGQKRRLTITGTVISPEFIYTIGPAAMMPDNLRFGILWMGRQALSSVFGLDGAFNDVTLRLNRGANPREVRDQLDRLLKPYGGSGSYTRETQISHSYLQSEMDQLDNMARILPPVFFLISAYLVNMVLGRLIALEREQIGLFKALGYGNFEIGWHYVKLAMMIGFWGVLLGWVLGTWGGHGLALLYTQFFTFPYLIFITSPDVYAISGIAGVATAALGAVRAVRQAVVLSPAVAMAPPAPPNFRSSRLDRIGHWLGLRQTSMMILRSIGRWPLRAFLTSLGIALSAATMVASLFMFDSMDELMDTSFFQENRQHATLTTIQNIPETALADVENLPGVLVAEGARSLPARLHLGHLSRLIAIEGRSPDMDLARVVDPRTDEPIDPGNGIVLAERLAGHLDAKTGDLIEVELLDNSHRVFEVPVTAVIPQYFGMGAYMNLDTISGFLDEQPQINQVQLSLDRLQIDDLYRQIKVTPGVAGIVLWENIRKSFDETIAENAGITTFVYSFIASLMVIGVVYNAARIQLSERARELASLRILGFTRAEISYVLLGELMLLTFVAIPLGLILGYLFAAGMAAEFSNDLYTIPLVVSAKTYAGSTAVVFAASLASALLVRRRLDHLDLIAVMKSRE